MFRKLLTAAALTAATLGSLTVAAPAEARWHHGGGYYDRGYHRHYGAGWGRNDYGRRCYDRGNGGLAIGAVAGGLAGNAIAGHGDKTLGTVIGAVGGGLIGRSIDRHDGRC
jgi:hypothetical protein